MKTVNKISIVFFLVLAFFVSSQNVYTITPNTISYQGVLTNNNNDIVEDGTYSVLFKLYNQESSGTELWYETQNITTSNGIFNVELGIVNNLTSIDFNQVLFLELTLNSEILNPRIKFTAQPYAFMAKSIIGGSIDNSKIGENQASTGKFTSIESQSLKITNGNPEIGKVLVSDNLGNATWSNTTGLSVLGSIATQNSDNINITGGNIKTKTLEIDSVTTFNGIVKLSYFSTSSTSTLEANFAKYSVISYTGTAVTLNLAFCAAGSDGQFVFVVNNKALGTLSITGGQTLPNKAVGLFVFTEGNWRQVY